jgi:hypothetical protein
MASIESDGALSLPYAIQPPPAEAETLATLMNLPREAISFTAEHLADGFLKFASKASKLETDLKTSVTKLTDGLNTAKISRTKAENDLRDEQLELVGTRRERNELRREHEEAKKALDDARQEGERVKEQHEVTVIKIQQKLDIKVKALEEASNEAAAREEGHGKALKAADDAQTVALRQQSDSHSEALKKAADEAAKNASRKDREHAEALNAAEAAQAAALQQQSDSHAEALRNAADEAAKEASRKEQEHAEALNAAEAAQAAALRQQSENHAESLGNAADEAAKEASRKEQEYAEALEAAEAALRQRDDNHAKALKKAAEEAANQANQSDQEHTKALKGVQDVRDIALAEVSKLKASVQKWTDNFRSLEETAEKARKDSAMKVLKSTEELSAAHAARDIALENHHKLTEYFSNERAQASSNLGMLQKEVTSLRTELDEALEAATQANEALDGTKKAKEGSVAQGKASQTVIRALKRDVDRARRGEDRMDAHEMSLLQRLESSNSEKDTIGKELKELRLSTSKERQESNEREQNLERQLEGVASSKECISSELSSLKASLDQKTSERSDQKGALEQSNAAVSADVGKLRSLKEDLDKQYRALQGRLNECDAKKCSIEESVQLLEKQKAEWETERETLQQSIESER